MDVWKKRKKADDFFVGINFRKMEELMDNLMKSMFSNRDIRDLKKPITLGFSMKIDENGKPRIKEFGNVAAMPKKTMIAKARQPLVDMVDSGDCITITAELPGVERKDLELGIEGHKITISTSSAEPLYKTMNFDSQVLPETASVSLKNGILEITILKMGKRKQKNH